MPKIYFIIFSKYATNMRMKFSSIIWGTKISDWVYFERCSRTKINLFFKIWVSLALNMGGNMRFHYAKHKK